MAEREAAKSTGRLTSYVVLVYLSVGLGSRPYPPSDEAKVEAPPYLPSSATPPLPDSVTVPIPDPPSQAAVPNNNGNKLLHSVIEIVEEKKLGTIFIALVIPISMGIVVTGKDKLAEYIVLILLCLSFTAILLGMGLKKTCPKFAQIIELVGIVLVVISFYAVVASYLPAVVSWVPGVCLALCLLTFGIIAVGQPPPN